MKNISKIVYGLGISLLALVLNASAQLKTNEIQGPFFSELVTPLVLDVDLRTLPTIRPWQPGDPVREVEDLRDPIPLPLGMDQVRKVSGGSRLSQPAAPDSGLIGVNFEGTPSTALGLVPPDTVGDVGPNHYIQAVNTSFSIYDKQGNLLVGPTPINSLWMGFGGACETLNNGDPIVQYDHLADRWLISQFALPSGAQHQCFAISRTGDPVTGGWFLYDFTTPDFPDYPKITVWPDAYYMSTQRGFFGDGLDVYAFDRTSMLMGAPATYISFFVGPVGNRSLFLMPSDLDGPLPPAGTPNFFVRQVDGERFGGIDRLDLFAFSVNWAAPALSTFTQLPSLPTAPFDSILCSANLLGACIPQPGTSQTLETLTVWPMWRMQYRNFDSYETLVLNHTVDADGADHAGIRWYELRRSSANPWFIFQQGTYAPDEGAPGMADDVHRWMGSIAMDAAGNIALGYSVSSGTVYPGIRFTGQLAGDPPGTMTLPELTIIEGGGSQTTSFKRWGNYSAMTVDPLKPCQFWYTTEYYDTTSAAGWKTRIASFSLDLQPPMLSCPEEIVQANDPGECSAVVYYTVTAMDECGEVLIVCDPLPGSVFAVGTTIVTCTAIDAVGNSTTCTFPVSVEDREAPLVTCHPTTNPAGKKVPAAGRNPKSGQNPDGFYQFVAADNCDASPQIFVGDSASSFVAGPFESGAKFKIVQAPGGKPRQKRGPRGIRAHITLRGEAVVFAVDADGNISSAATCHLPPPPK